MPRMGVGLFVRPDYDGPTETGHYYLGLAKDYAAERGISVIDLPSDLAAKANIFSALETEDPVFCYFNGHGSEDRYYAQYLELVMETCLDDEVLIGRVVIILSCSCGVGLGPDAVMKGATTVFAYTIDFTWMTDYPEGYFESVNAISNALVDGRTTQEAMDLSLASWNDWIDYWADSEDPMAPTIIGWMIHDRDGQVLLGNPNAMIVDSVTLDSQEGTKSHDQVATLQDGRIIAMGKNYLEQNGFFDASGDHSAGCEAINVRVPDLRMIEYVLNIQFLYKTDVCTHPIYEAVNKKIIGNVVGMTLLGASNSAGGTLHVEVIAIGV